MPEREKFTPLVSERSETLARLGKKSKEFYDSLVIKFSDKQFSLEELISTLTNSKKGRDYDEKKRIATEKLNSLFQNGLIKVESKGALRTYQVIK